MTYGRIKHVGILCLCYTGYQLLGVSESKRVSIMWGKLRIFLEISVHCLGQ